MILSHDAMASQRCYFAAGVVASEGDHMAAEAIKTCLEAVL